MKQHWNYDLPVWQNLLIWFIGIVAFLGTVFGLMCLTSWLVMLLWNAILPLVFVGFSTITFWQSVGIYVIVWLLFGGLGKTISQITKD